MTSVTGFGRPSLGCPKVEQAACHGRDQRGSPDVFACFGHRARRAARARCRFGRVRGPGWAARGGDRRGWGLTPHGVGLAQAPYKPKAVRPRAPHAGVSVWWQFAPRLTALRFLPPQGARSRQRWGRHVVAIAAVVAGQHRLAERGLRKPRRRRETTYPDVDVGISRDVRCWCADDASST